METAQLVVFDQYQTYRRQSVHNGMEMIPAANEHRFLLMKLNYLKPTCLTGVFETVYSLKSEKILL